MSECGCVVVDRPMCGDCGHFPHGPGKCASAAPPLMAENARLRARVAELEAENATLREVALRILAGRYGLINDAQADALREALL